MALPPGTSYNCCVDEQDRITSVDEAWLAFAAQNDAPHLTPEALHMRSLWDFINGPETRYLYGLLFQKVRSTGRPLEVFFRCDSPGLRRHMKLEIQPRPGGALNLCTRLLREEPRDRVALLSPDSTRSEKLLKMCSWCKKVETTDSNWEDVEAAVQSLGLLEESPSPRITHVICPDCQRDMMALLRG